MMTPKISNYVRVLYELVIPEESIRETEEIFKKAPQLKEILGSPVVSREKKERIIERIFPEAMRNYLKAACVHGKIEYIEEILEEYWEYSRKRQKVLTAALYYVTPPTKEQEEKMKVFLCRKYHMKDVALSMEEKPELLGGFLLRAGNVEYDFSLRGRLQQLKQKLTWR